MTLCKGVSHCLHAIDRVPVWSLRGEPLGGTNNSAAVQGKDKVPEFPNLNPLQLMGNGTEQH